MEIDSDDELTASGNVNDNAQETEETLDAASCPHSEEQLAFIGEIAGEGAALYPAGTICQNAETLRHSVRSWAAKKGFAVMT